MRIPPTWTAVALAGARHVPPVARLGHRLAVARAEQRVHRRLPERERFRSRARWGRRASTPISCRDSTARRATDTNSVSRASPWPTARCGWASAPIRVPIARDTASAVHFLQLILAAGVADTLGPAVDAGVDGRVPAQFPRFPRRFGPAWPSRFPLDLAPGQVSRRARVRAGAGDVFRRRNVVGAWPSVREYGMPSICGPCRCCCSISPSFSASRCCWPSAREAPWSACSARSPSGESAGRSISAGTP